ncbi:MAG: cyclic nucleotide-binding domain-containing protein [Nitrospirae bacterium]|nr:cyclic nucleotide-binding domain-containing protein [Nitrospirota bacterium]
MAHAQCLSARKGRILVEKGDSVGGVFIVLDGTLRVFGMNSRGKEATLYWIQNQEACFFSINCIFSDLLYPAWVAVESRLAEVAVIPAKIYSSLFTKEIEIQKYTFDNLAPTVLNLMARLDHKLYP